MKRNQPREGSAADRRLTAFVFRLFARFTEGGLSPKEQEIFSRWSAAAGSTDLAKSRLEHQLVWNHINNSIQRRRPARHYLAAAAVLLLLFTTGLTWFQNEKASVANPAGWTVFRTGDRETKMLTMPDGSHIYLNSGSALVYKKAEYNHSRREIWLTEGEAFFEVAKNPQKKFIVNYAGLQTVVLGTSFNIKAYAGSDESSVVVRTGRVLVQKAGKSLGLLTADRRLVYHKDRDAQLISTADGFRANAWTDGTLVFDDAPFSEMARKLKLKYNVDLQLTGMADEDVRLTSTFAEDEELETVLSAIARVNELIYDRQGTTITFYSR